MNFCHVIIVVVLLTIGVSECLECFDCLNIADPKSCTNTSQCSNSESCYLQTLHSAHEELYNMGCQTNQLCSSVAVNPNGIIGRSIQTRQQYSCHECCSSNRCNEHLCAHRKRHAVAFNAHGLNVLANYVNAFPTVIFNEGNAYNASSGHFTAPVDGIYYFSAQICPIYNNGLYIFMERGTANMSVNTRLTATYAYIYASRSCVSASSSVKLTRNEHVWVLMGGSYSTSNVYESGDMVWMTFTGTLIQEL